MVYLIHLCIILNDKFAFHTFLLAPDTDKSTFATGHAHYGQLTHCLHVALIVCGGSVFLILVLLFSTLGPSSFATILMLKMVILL